MVKLTTEQQDGFVDADPAAFAPVKGGWGKKGATNVRLKTVARDLLRPDVLEIRVAADDALRGSDNTAGALRKRMESMSGDPRLFDGFCVCVRQKAP